jgi:predicted ATP-dependent endonuclease of OLD family
MLEQTTGDQPDAQVLATTHSPTVLETADEDTLDGSLVVGWDSDDQASRVEPLRALLNKLEGKARLADLQSEGWLQFAADR